MSTLDDELHVLTAFTTRLIRIIWTYKFVKLTIKVYSSVFRTVQCASHERGVLFEFISQNEKEFRFQII